MNEVSTRMTQNLSNATQRTLEHTEHTDPSPQALLQEKEQEIAGEVAVSNAACAFCKRKKGRRWKGSKKERGREKKRMSKGASAKSFQF